ncbi:MAG: NAD(P)/FAD-dependent oxidoreductase [Kiloniellaceae bacterium]
MTGKHLHCDVAVVGAGPAGLAAAEAAARSGAEVICIDQFNQAGGQYHMQPPGPESVFQETAQVAQGRAAIEVARAAGVRFLLDSELFWASLGESGAGFQLSLCRHGGEAAVVSARTLVAACGAMERPLPFAGWTLPGVISAGAAQRLMKAGTVEPRLPFEGATVLAGSGPFLLAVASTFAKAGQRLDHFVEMQPAAPLRVACKLARYPERLGEALRLLVDLRRSGAQRHFGAIVTRALGGDRLEAVEVAPLAADGRPDITRARRIEGVGALCVGYGFQPVIDLTTALGAEHAFDPALGGWHCVVEPGTGRTSVVGLFAAGEVTGVGGAQVARASGRVAGLRAAAAACRGTVASAETASLSRDLLRARRFARDLARLYPPPAFLPLDLPKDETLCRCEDVSLGDIRRAVADGARDMLAVKMWTRAGMGPCQGRICGAAVGAVLRQAGVSAEQAQYNRSHLPLRPVPVDVVRAALAPSTLTEEAAE